MAAPRVSLDKLPMKRLFSLEEAGAEHFPPEPTPDEKPLALLQRIDFSRVKEKGKKKSKSSKDTPSQPPTAWPWQGVIDHLQQAQQELAIILDLIAHVEANEVLNVANMVRTKLSLPHEDLAIRVSSKLQYFQVVGVLPMTCLVPFLEFQDRHTSTCTHLQVAPASNCDVGSYVKKTAKALERQVEREAVFYGALMRLQLNWKIKRQKGIAAVSGGSAGFSLDLAFPILSETSSSSSLGAASLCIINVDQDPTGLLVVQPPPGRSINTLTLTFGSPVHKSVSAITHRDMQTEKHMTISEAGTVETEAPIGRAVVTGVEKGAKRAHFVLRGIQGAVYDEQVFECISKEALLPSPALHVTEIRNSRLQLSLDPTTSIIFELSQNTVKNDDIDELGVKDNSSTTEMEVPPKATDCNMQTGDALRACNLPDSNQEFNPRSESEQYYPSDRTLKLCLQQAFYQNSFGRWIAANKSELGMTRSTFGPAMTGRVKESSSVTGVGAGKDLSLSGQSGILRNFSAILRHGKLCAEVLVTLEKLVESIRHLHLYFHPTWNPRVSAWDISFSIPTTDSRGWTRQRSWNGEKEMDLLFNCTIVVRDESLSIEGLEGLSLFEIPVKEKFHEFHLMTKYSCTQSELPSFLLRQISGSIVHWLYEEATVLGLNAKKQYLGVIFTLPNSDDIAILASPDVNSHVINWLIKSGVDLEDPTTNGKLSHKTVKRLIGPKSPQVLRNIVIEILNSSGYSAK